MATKKKTGGTKAAGRNASRRRVKAVEVTVEKQPVQAAPAADQAPAQRDDSGEICVFAIRLRRSERDEIHAAAGSAKASSFVRGLALAAARGDMKLVQEIVDSVKQ